MANTSPLTDSVRAAATAMPKVVLSKRTGPVSSNEERKVDVASAVLQTDAVASQAEIAKTENESADQPSVQWQTAQRIQKAIEEFQGRATGLEFRVDDQTDQVIVRVVNKASGKVIRQIPPEEFIEMSKRLADLRGILFDQTT
jgi:flagellar protein FlaG